MRRRVELGRKPDKLLRVRFHKNLSNLFRNCPHVHLFPPELSSQCKLLQVRSLQTSSKLAEESAVSREQIHKQEVRAGLFKYFGVFQHFISN